MSENVESLKWYVEKNMKVGETAQIATSTYATGPNAAPRHHHWDHHSTPQAVRSVEKSGLINASYGWRHYTITRLK